MCMCGIFFINQTDKQMNTRNQLVLDDLRAGDTRLLGITCSLSTNPHDTYTCTCSNTKLHRLTWSQEDRYVKCTLLYIVSSIYLYTFTYGTYTYWETIDISVFSYIGTPERQPEDCCIWTTHGKPTAWLWYLQVHRKCTTCFLRSRIDSRMGRQCWFL